MKHQPDNQQKLQKTVVFEVFSIALLFSVTVLTIKSTYDINNIYLFQKEQSGINIQIQTLPILLESKLSNIKINSDLVPQLNTIISVQEIRFENLKSLLDTYQQNINGLITKQNEIIYQLVNMKANFDQVPQLNTNFLAQASKLEHFISDFNSLNTDLKKAQDNIVETKFSLESTQANINNLINNMKGQTQDQQKSMSDQIIQLNTKIDAVSKKNEEENKQFDQLSTYLSAQINLNKEQETHLLSNIESVKVELKQSQDYQSQLGIKVDSISQQIPNLNRTLSTLDSRINSDTFNKVELVGPFMADTYTQNITMSKTKYVRFITTKLCILEIKAKAIVTLIANGQSDCQTNYAQLTFMKDGEVVNTLPYEAGNNWYEGQQYMDLYPNPVSLTQEFFIEQKGTHEFALGVQYKSGETLFVELKGVSFIAKITYIS